MAAHGELSIARLSGRYLVPRQHPHPQALQKQLDRALEKGVPQALERWLRPALEQGDEGVWLIRHLETNLVLDAGVSEEGRLGMMLGRQISAAIERTLHAPPDGANSLYFPTWADYAARFAADLLEGRAWDAWYYAPFDGLRFLELGQALRQAILQRPEHTGAVLLRLAQDGALDRLLRTLGEGGAQAVYQALPSSPQPVEPSMLATILDVWPAALSSGSSELDSAANRLRLWAAWRLGEDRRVDPHLEAQAHAAIDLLLELAGQVEKNGWRRRVVASQGDSTAAFLTRLEQFADARKVEPLRKLAESDPARLDSLARILSGEAQPLPADSASQSAAAGLFLLLPAWVDLRLHTLFESHAPTEQTAAVWRYWLALKCLGAMRLEASRRDPALLAAVGLEVPPSKEDISDALHAASELHRPLQRAFLQVLLSQGRVDGRWLAAETCPLPGGSEAGLLRDLRLDYWLDIAALGGAGATAESRAARLAWVAAALGYRAEVVWESGSPPAPELAERFADYFHKAKPGAAELAYFHMAELPAEVDCLWSLLARATLRNFAGRLMGFAWSSAEHLYANFLHGAGAVRHTPQGWDVELPRAPLHTVLRLAGLREETLELPWLAERVVRLAFRDAG